METEDEENLTRIEMDYEYGQRMYQDEMDEEFSRQANTDEEKINEGTYTKMENSAWLENLLAREVEHLKHELSVIKPRALTRKTQDVLREEVENLKCELSITKKTPQPVANGNTEHHYNAVIDDTTDHCLVQESLLDSLVPDISVPILIPTSSKTERGISDEFNGLEYGETRAKPLFDLQGTKQEGISAAYGIAIYYAFQEHSLTALHFTNWRNVQVPRDILFHPPGYSWGINFIASKKRKKI